MANGMSLRILFFLIVLSGCSTGTRQPVAPWQAAAIADAPQVYRTAWQEAENRKSCALVAFASPPDNATPRRASFAGGWGIAYDTPSQRSAFGIAGTGAEASGAAYEWPDQRVWGDGSSATWGLEGGSGPNHLAYVRIAGQDCLYNIWSALGEEHLESLLQQIRFVDL